MSRSESFLQAWSRRKLQSAAQRPLPAPTESRSLPAGDTRDCDAEGGGFMQPEVERATRYQALRKLFMSEHYRVMDGLDVYVGDYSRPAVLPPALLATLVHAQDLLPVGEESAPPTMPAEQV